MREILADIVTDRQDRPVTSGLGDRERRQGHRPHLRPVVHDHDQARGARHEPGHRAPHRQRARRPARGREQRARGASPSTWPVGAEDERW